jgi:proteasome accessory factor B
MSAAKTERLLNLVICLLATRRFLTREQIRRAVDDYARCESDGAFERMFERDKDELREMGVPIETGRTSALFDDEPGYRIDREAYALPEVSFEPDELAVLGLASRVWQQASLAGPASRALLKLTADTADADSDDSPLLGIEPRVRTSEPAFEGLYQAVRDRRPVTFPYRAGRADGVAERHLEPWGIVSWRGRWYVVGHDRDRRATRVFRLSRVVGPVRPIGAPGDVVVPEDVDIRGAVVSMDSEPQQGDAVVQVRSGAGFFLRRRASSVSPADVDPGTWDIVKLPYRDVEALADELAGNGSAVIALEPPELRDAVVRRLTAARAAQAAPAATMGRSQ